MEARGSPKGAWILASLALGLALGIVPCSGESDFGVLPVLILGLGAVQSLVLRGSVRAWRWGLATTLGLIVAVPFGYAAAIAVFGGLSTLLRPSTDPDFGPLLVLGVAAGAGALGLVLGAAQVKLAVRGGHLRIWMLASAGGVIAASPIALAITCSDVIAVAGLSLGRPLVTSLGGLGYGLVTSLALPRLVHGGQHT